MDENKRKMVKPYDGSLEGSMAGNFLEQVGNQGPEFVFSSDERGELDIHLDVSPFLIHLFVLGDDRQIMVNNCTVRVGELALLVVSKKMDVQDAWRAIASKLKETKEAIDRILNRYNY